MRGQASGSLRFCYGWGRSMRATAGGTAKENRRAVQLRSGHAEEFLKRLALLPEKHHATQHHGQYRELPEAARGQKFKPGIGYPYRGAGAKAGGESVADQRPAERAERRIARNFMTSIERKFTALVASISSLTTR